MLLSCEPFFQIHVPQLILSYFDFETPYSGLFWDKWIHSSMQSALPNLSNIYNDFLHLISLWFVRMMEVWFIEARKSRMIYSWMLGYIIMHCSNFLRIVNLSNDRHLMQVIHFDKSIAYLCITPAIVFAFSYFCTLWVFCMPCKLTCLLSQKKHFIYRENWK